MLQRKRKPRRGDRDISKLLLNKLHILSPLQGLLLSGYPVPGVNTPVCSLSHLRCFSPDSNKIECFVRQWPPLHMGKAIPTARKSDSHSKEKQFPQQGKAIPTARKIGSFVWEILIGCNQVRQVKARATYFCLIGHQIVTQSTYKRA